MVFFWSFSVVVDIVKEVLVGNVYVVNVNVNVNVKAEVLGQAKEDI